MHVHSRATEDALLAAAQSGELAALGEILRIHHQGVYRYGLQVCRTTEDAEDALQETLWAATRAIKTFRGSASSIVSWMFTIIRRECFHLLDRHRREPMAVADLEDRAVADREDPAAALEEQRRVDRLAQALGALDPLHREVVLLRDIEGLSAPEAAARLGITVQALKSRLHRARVNLRDQVLATGERF